MLSFRHTKQTSKNVANTTFNNFHQPFTWHNTYKQHKAYMPEDEKQKKKNCGIIRVIVSGIKNIIKYKKIKLFHK